MKYQSHPLRFVIPDLDYYLICYFKNGEIKKFDFKPIMEKYPEFLALKKNNLFNRARVDFGGLCVTFNEDLDISEETLYQNGVTFNIKKENEKILKNIYSYCKEIRKKQGITQKQLSAMSNIPQSGLARIESGASNVSLNTLTSYLNPLGYKIVIEKK
ncbi:MAG: DUF2442 domain-containing protein [Bacilli bacterium]|nr:DUF2442 domain-containing protein [Bacilli bacterium]